MPLVSIIMPVYNAENTLSAAYAMIKSQTLCNWELLFVDDASCDKSLEILAAISQQDARVHVFRHEANRGAGAARNTGLAAAQGEYLLFLDADDLFEPDLLERAVQRAKNDQASIVLLGCDHYLETENRCQAAPEMLNVSLLPHKRPFSASDVPQHLFQLCTPEVWNKLFSRQFILKEKLHFQEIPNSNDLCFALTALSLGQISVEERLLVHYRIASSEGIQNRKHAAPFAFAQALASLQEELKRRGRWILLEQSFINCALFHINFNYRSTTQPRAHSQLAQQLRQLYKHFGITGKAAEFFSSRYEFQQYVENICQLPDFCPDIEEGSSDFFRSASKYYQQTLAQTKEEVECAKEQIADIHASITYRLGRFLTWPLRKFRNFITKETP